MSRAKRRKPAAPEPAPPRIIPRGLFTAILRDEIDEVGRAIEAGHDVDMTLDPSRDRPLHLAAFHGRSEIVQLLLSNRADPNARGDRDRTPLHALARSTERGATEDMVRAFVAHGADVDLRDDHGLTPLETALALHRHDLAVELIGSGKVTEPSGAWIAASTLGLVELLEPLLAAGAKLEDRGGSGETAFLAAAAHGRVHVMQRLRELGADLQARDGAGRGADEVIRAAIADASTDARTMGVPTHLRADVDADLAETRERLAAAAAWLQTASATA